MKAVLVSASLTSLPIFTQWLNSEARACKALQCWCNSSLGVQISGCGSKVDHVPWEHVHAGSSPAVLTIFAYQAHEDERRPDKPQAVGSNPTVGTNHARPPELRGARSARAGGAFCARTPIGRGHRLKPGSVRVRISRRTPFACLMQSADIDSSNLSSSRFESESRHQFHTSVGKLADPRP